MEVDREAVINIPYDLDIFLIGIILPLKNQSKIRIPLIAFPVMILTLLYLNVWMKQANQPVGDQLQTGTCKSCHQRGCKYQEISIDDRSQHLLPIILKGTLTRCFPPAGPATGAKMKIHVMESEMVHRMALCFQFS